MIDDTDAKQNYLRENILEKNYNPEEFIEYLTAKYGEGATDIEQYSLSDLKKIVDEFCNSVTPQENTEKNNIEENENKEINENNNEFTDNNNNNPEEINDNKLESFITNHHHLVSEANGEMYEDVLKCKKIEVSEISFQKLNISIVKPEKKEGGLFSKSYITYLVITEPFNYEVRRRYSDFEWLRSTLANQFPTFWIPPIPFKNYSDRFDNEFIDKRMRYLEKFLYSIAENPTLGSTIYFHDFLYLSPDDFNEKKKKYGKLKAPVNLTDLQSIDGSVRNIHKIK